ncbi:MAG: hypothetical protein WCX93_00555, partial [Burkholderiaceae bacterium]
MQKRSIQRGRPLGATTYDAELAQAFGAAVRALRTERGIAQEMLANRNRSARGVIPWPCFTSETTRHDQQGGRSGRWTDREQTSSG